MNAAIPPQKSLETCCALRVEAVTAVNRTIRLRLERDFRVLAALGADHMEHLTLAAVLITTAATLVTAVTAACRLVLKALLCIELLLSGREYEVVAAFLAYECLVFKCHSSTISLEKIVNLSIRRTGKAFSEIMVRQSLIT